MGGTYGWVVSPEVEKRYEGSQAFLHINDCEDGFLPKQGQTVTFQLAEHREGNPKCVKVAPVKPAHTPVTVSGRDWFQDRDQKRVQMSLRPQGSLRVQR